MFLFLGLSPFPGQAAEPVQVVQVQGFGTIIGGDTAQARDEAIIDARIRAVEQVAGVVVVKETLSENKDILDSMIRTQRSGFIQEDRVLDEGPTNDGRYRVTLEAQVAPRELKERLTSLMSDLSIVVLISETNIGREHQPPIVENVLIAKLVEAGYRVIDPEQLRQIRSRDQELALLQGDVEAAKRIGLLFLANLIITGGTLAEFGQINEGIVSAYARVQARIVEAESGNIITNFEQGGIKGFALSPEAAGQQALRQATKPVVDHLLHALDQYLKRKDRLIEVRIRGLHDEVEFRRLKHLLQSLRWVSEVQEKRFSQAESLFLVRYPEKPAYLATRLARDPSYRLLAFDHRRIALELKR